MIISNTPNRSGSSRLLMLAFIFALSIPLGASGAEDKKAKTKASPKDLYKQIEAAVIAGKISKEEAQAKLIALKKQGSPKSEAIKKGDGKKTIAHLENIWAELQSLVAIGKMSSDEAASVMSTIKQKVFATTSVNRKKANIKTSPKDLYKQIEAAVAAGKITKEQAQAKLNALKKGGPGKKHVKGKETKTKPRPKDLYKQIEAAVAAGKITKEEAQAKLKALKLKGFLKKNVKGSKKKGFPKKNVKGSKKKGSPKTAEQGKKAVTEAYLKKVWTELQAAVAAGKLTKEEAAAKMNAIKKAKLGGK